MIDIMPTSLILFSENLEIVVKTLKSLFGKASKMMPSITSTSAIPTNKSIIFVIFSQYPVYRQKIQKNHLLEIIPL